MYALEKKWGGIRYWGEVGTVYYLVKETVESTGNVVQDFVGELLRLLGESGS